VNFRLKISPLVGTIFGSFPGKETSNWGLPSNYTSAILNKKAVLPQGNRAMPQVFFSVEVRQQHSLQV